MVKINEWSEYSEKRQIEYGFLPEICQPSWYKELIRRKRSNIYNLKSLDTF